MYNTMLFLWSHIHHSYNSTELNVLKGNTIKHKKIDL